MMSIADHEIEEPSDDGIYWCTIHDYHYRVGHACPACRDEQADRAVDERLNQKHGLA